ncbi:kinase-like domain-containing protein [Lasiosphaeria ovina]|uniref:Kinase-like domain-containing protein n=1 Tax=Lasiosphaeria ovina TaxID=92902 RepID=A0AAE0KG89_9PEZI|nr:kinase-like domain-containing protein [Lasiosphaeria ovina]
MAEFAWIKSFSTSNYGLINDTPPKAVVEAPLQQADFRLPEESPARGSFATFVCHVSSLDAGLRLESPVLKETSNSSKISLTGRLLGQGRTFVARHALWARNPNEPRVEIALKEIVCDVLSADDSDSPSSARSDWKDILFEIRTLFHPPLRYHPNLVRLLGIQWGLPALSDSSYPTLIMEYATLGTLAALQSSSSEALSLAVKQKMCYDVGRGISALHACGVVHGDVKHENVLIFLIRKTSRTLRRLSERYRIFYPTYGPP